MTSATQSNSGASAYLGFLSAALNSPPIITMQDLQSNDLAQKMTTLLGGVNRSSGSSEWLKALFLVGEFDAMVNYEALILETNQQRVASNKEPLYMVYPVDGTTIADYGLGYINNGNNEQEKNFQLLQDYLLSVDTQAEIQKLGRRTGFGGVMKDVDPKVFVPEWGFDANRVLSAINFPEADVMLEALNLYQTAFKKPSYTVFLLDFSGSMTSNNGEENLKKGMELILDQNIAKQNLLQGSNRDIIVVIPFNDHVINVWKSEGVVQYPELLNKINDLNADGGTNIYDPAITALDLLKDVNPADYTTSITLMTDGKSEGNYSALKQSFDSIGKDIPIYSILGLSAAAVFILLYLVLHFNWWLAIPIAIAVYAGISFLFATTDPYAQKLKDLQVLADLNIGKLNKYIKGIPNSDIRNNVQAIIQSTETAITFGIKRRDQLSVINKIVMTYTEPTVSIMEKYMQIADQRLQTDVTHETIKKVEEMINTIKESIELQVQKLIKDDLSELTIQLDVMLEMSRWEDLR
jgi:hypothetical protein